MKRDADHTAKTGDASMPEPFPSMAAFNGKFLEFSARAEQAFFENAFNLNQEMMRFAGDRLQADIEALQDLARCSNWQDMVNFQSEFARSATDAYLAEMPKLTEQAARTCTAMWAPVFESAKAFPETVAKT